MNADDLVMIAKEVDTLDVLVNNAGNPHPHRNVDRRASL